jgi:hypothetical protein
MDTAKLLGEGGGGGGGGGRNEHKYFRLKTIEIESSLVNR